MHELFGRREVGAAKVREATDGINAALGLMVLVIAAFILLQPLIFPNALSGAGRKQTGPRWKVVPDIQPINLEGKLNELEAQGYAINRESNIAVVGTSFTLIFNSDEWSPEADEDGVEK